MLVTLNVLVPTCPEGVMMYVTGSCSELGSWSPQAAKLMTLVSSTECGDLWSATVEVSVTQFEYRYFTASILQSFRSSLTENCSCLVAVQNWESMKKSRVVDTTAVSVNCEKDVYGAFNGVSSVSRGWLTGQFEICLRIHSESLWLKDDASLQANYLIKCEPVDMRPADNCGMLCCKHRRFGPVHAAGFTRDGLSHRDIGVISLSKVNDHVTFKVQTCVLEMMAFKFVLYSNSGDGNYSGANEIGAAFFKMGTAVKSDITMIPIVSSQQHIIGILRVSAVVVNSIKNLPQAFNFSQQCWNKPKQSLNIGHRGLGKSYNKGVASARVPENTILSFSEAAKSGADMVEFDVILTSDNVPVIFHDFMAGVDVTSIDGCRSHCLKVPVTDLTVEELNTLKILKFEDLVAGKVNRNKEERPFPTLRHCFETVDPDLKFNIEVKYCMHLLSTGQYEEGVQHFPHRNAYVDVILDNIFKHAGDREILLSCFDPDVCIMMRAKQARYPVAFLSQGEASQYETFEDSRAASLQMAVNFANVESLNAVVLHTGGLLKNMKLIDLAHSYGLCVFCWGEENNDVNTMKMLRKHMLDGIICDRVDEFIHAIEQEQ